MKEALRQAGVPTAASAAVDTADEVRSTFADAIGFPLILKPRAGAGAQGTARVDSMAELRRARSAGFGDADSIAVEEFVEGHEGFYDTITIDGHVVHDWVTHYYPNVLEAMRHRWISPAVHHHQPDRRRASFYGEVREMGARVIEALGHRHVGDAHGVVLRARRGCGSPRSAAARRVSARGTSTPRPTTSTSTASGRTRSCTAAPDSAMSRQYSAGIVALRPSQDGQIQRLQRRSRTIQRAVRPVDHRRPPARPRHADPAGRGRATWPTRGSGCGTPTTTRCAGCSTTSGRTVPASHAAAEPAGDSVARPSCSARNGS